MAYPESLIKIGHDFADNDKFWAWRTLMGPDWRLEEQGRLDLDIKDDVGGC